MKIGRSHVAWALLFLAAGCTAPVRTTVSPEASPPIRTNENLHSTLWTQTSVEYRASTLQAYRLAMLMLDRALADSSWTAALEQEASGSYASLPPAVVLDVDETVLDNSAYQARLVLEDAAYASDSWNAWVQEARAVPVPGAVAFTRYAHDKGVTVIYLTNRRGDTEEATRRNLAAYGFPIATSDDVVLTRGERPEWAEGEKAPRRRAVAEKYRILLLVGDNLGDFMPDAERSVEERDEATAPYDAYWGTRWIMLPNPQYGSWESALFDNNYSLPAAERMRRKYERLDPVGAPLPKQ